MTVFIIFLGSKSIWCIAGPSRERGLGIISQAQGLLVDPKFPSTHNCAVDLSNVKCVKLSMNNSAGHPKVEFAWKCAKF